MAFRFRECVGGISSRALPGFVQRDFHGRVVGGQFGLRDRRGIGIANRLLRIRGEFRDPLVKKRADRLQLCQYALRIDGRDFAFASRLGDVRRIVCELHIP